MGTDLPTDETMAAPSTEDTGIAPTLSSGQIADVEPASPAIGMMRTIDPGCYEVIGEYARGGLGRILRARDRRSGRLVAIKEMLVSNRDAARRFVREALVTANLQHPSIVPVYEVGRWPGGQPFYAMKLVTGQSLADAIRAAPTTEARLALLPHVIDVAEALAYAHGEGVIHRDLKPANVLVGAHGETVVIDWGLAKRVGVADEPMPARSSASSGGHTLEGSVLGTPAYMPPEQAEGRAVDERADVYAIGAMLRHLLVGRPAYDGVRNAVELLARVLAAPPPPLADAVPDLPADLIAIVDKAMARSADDRYRSADELATDLRRFTTGQLVSAHRYTSRERLRRFVRRHRATLAVAALAVAALAVFGVYSVSRIVAERDRARLEQRRAEAASADATARLAALFEDRARLELLSDRPQRGLPLIAEAVRLGRDTPVTRFLAAAASHAMELQAGRRELSPFETGVFVPGGHDFIYGDGKNLRRWNPDDQRVAWEVPLAGLNGLHPLSADTLVVALPGTLVLIDLATGARNAILATGEPFAAYVMELAPDGDTLAVQYDDGTIQLWSISKLQLLRSFETDGPAGEIEFTPDGRRLLVVGYGLTQTAVSGIWDVSNGTRLAVPCQGAERCREVAVAPDGSLFLLAAGTLNEPDGSVIAIDTGFRRRYTIPTASSVMELAIAGDTFAVMLRDGTVELRDIADGRLRWRSQAAPTGWGVWFSPDRSRLYAAAGNGGVAVLDGASGAVLERRTAELDTAGAFASDDGTRVALVVNRSTAWVWNLEHASGTAITASTTRTWRLDLDGERIVVGAEDGTLQIHDASSGAPRVRLTGHRERVLSTIFVDGLGLLTAARDGDACLWDPDTGAQRRCWKHGAPLRRAEPSPDRQTLITAALDGTIKQWDVATGELRRTWTMDRPAMVARYSPDGTQVVAMDEGATIRLWDAASGALIREIAGRPGPEHTGIDVAWSPDGQRLVAARRDGAHWLFTTDLAHEDLQLEGDQPPSNLYAAAFRPDSKRVMLTGADTRVRIWDAESGVMTMTIDVDRQVMVGRYSPDGTLLATGDTTGLVRIWDPETGLELMRRSAPGAVYVLQWSRAGDALAIGTDGPTALIWRLPTAAVSAAALVEQARCTGTWRLDGDNLVPQPKPDGC